MEIKIQTPLSEYYKELTIIEALLLCYIQQNIDESGNFIETDSQIAKALNINIASLPTLLNKLLKLIYIEQVYNEENKRILRYIPIGLNGDIKSKQGFIYIMEDASLPGYYKVGFSKSPSHREYTLQAQKPTIKLLKKFVGSIQEEHAVHRYLDKFRVRGEWMYGLTVEQIDKAIKKIIGIK